MKLTVIKTILMSAGLLFVLGTTAQSSKRTSAYYAYKDWLEEKDKTSEGAKKSIIEAKKLIDEVYEYSSDKFTGKKDAKTLYYKGKIYSAFEIYMTDETMTEHNPQMLVAQGMMAYKEHVELPNKKSKDDMSQEIGVEMAIKRDMIFSLASEDFNKALELDKKGKRDESKTEFTNAMTKYTMAAGFLGVAGKLDTAALYNAGLCATFSENWAVAEQTLKVCVDNNFGGAIVVSQLADAYYNQDKSDEGTKVLEEGRKKYPKDINLYTSEGNYWLRKKESKKAALAYEKAIAVDPTNEAVYNTTGALYYEVEEYAEAEKYFLKAVEIKPDYADALYSLAGVYFNQGVQLSKEINEMALGKVDEEIEKKRDDYMRKAIPYGEKVRAIVPDDKQNLKLLYNAYETLGMKEKSKEIADILFN